MIPVRLRFVLQWQRLLISTRGRSLESLTGVNPIYGSTRGLRVGSLDEDWGTGNNSEFLSSVESLGKFFPTKSEYEKSSLQIILISLSARRSLLLQNDKITQNIPTQKTIPTIIKVKATFPSLSNVKDISFLDLPRLTNLVSNCKNCAKRKSK